VQPDPGLDAALHAARGGETSAFNSLVQLHQRQIFNLCYRTLGNPEDAADATQDTFLNAFRALRTFTGPSAALRGWLMRIAVNTCYDQLRVRQRRPTDSLDREDDLSPTEHVVDPSAGPEETSLNAETARLIQQAIDALPTEQRMTVVLCDVQGLSYEEAAQAMSIELGTVKSRLSRARAQLRLVLTEKGELAAFSKRLQEKNP
jgi:RNA polymerase sigma-70 factor (ECF subfamily)